MNKRHTALIAVLLATLGLAACDSTEDLTDAEVFVGSWQASAVTTPGLDLLDLLGTVTANFPTRRTFSMQAIDPSDDLILDISGTFEAEDGIMTFTITGGTRPVSMNYAFENDDNTVVFTFSGGILGELGFDINPTVLALIGSQQVTVTFTRR